MIQILEDQPSFAQQLGRLGGQSIAALAGKYFGDKMEQSASEKFAKEFGFNASREGRQEFYKSLGKEKGKQFGAKKGGAGEQSVLQDVFNNMSSMVAENLPGIGISPLTAMGISREGVESRAMFDSMRSRMESVLLPMVSKGNLSDTRFNFILSTIPKGDESQRKIVGKLRGLAKALADEGIPIDTSSLDEIPWASKELKEVSNKKQSKPPLSSFFE